jgi:hypothetical protein
MLQVITKLEKKIVNHFYNKYYNLQKYVDESLCVRCYKTSENA